MDRKLVGIVRYEKPYESLSRVVALSRGLKGLPHNARVFIKPNIVLWTRHTDFPKWGVITTSRLVEDTVLLLKEYGIEKITIGEGITLYDPQDKETPAHAFAYLGYNVLESRYGVKCINIHERPFERIDTGGGVSLNFNSDILQSDFVINMPVLKTHAQTVVSLGIKNLKGLLDINSRKKCHSADQERDLNYMISRLSHFLPSCLSIIDGIYTNARGPIFDGKAKRSNILISSLDILSADMVGAKILGYEPAEVPHLVHVAKESGRPLDLSDIEVVGERIEDVASRHPWTFPYTEDGTLSLPLKRMGIQGLSYPKYDLTLCTYCSLLYSTILTGIAQAWNGQPWDEVEVLTGKIMKPTPGKKQTILIGKCMYQANKDNPHINKMWAVKGCPPSEKETIEVFHRAGIPLNTAVFEDIEKYPGTFMKRYEGKTKFKESFFRIS